MEKKSSERYLLRGPQEGFVEIYQTVGQRLMNRLKCLKKRVIQVYPDESHSSSAEWILDRAIIERSQLRIHVAPGDTAIIFCSNTPHFAPVVVALLSLGVVCVPVSHHMPADELFPILGNVNPRVLVCMDDYAHILMRVYDKCPIVVAGEGRDTEDKELQLVPIEDFAQKPAFCLFTSGSSDITKKIMLTHRNIDVVLNSYRRSDSDLNEGDVVVASTPPHWYVGFLFQLLSMDLGCKVVVPNTFSKDGLYHLVSLYGATVMFLVPPQYFALCKSHTDRTSMLSTVRMALMAGMPVNARGQMFIQSQLDVPTVQWYGATEIQTATASYINRGQPPMGSIGKLKCWVDAKVVNVKGVALKANCEGELCFRGPYTSSDVTEEWFNSGDLGYYDEEGFLYLLDPIRDLILYKNIRVLPSEIELVLLEHHCVQEAAVVGVPRPTDGEVPAAAVVLRHAITAKDLIHFIEGSFPDRSKHLRGGLFIVRFIQKSAAGKVKRKELRELCMNLTKEIARPKPVKAVSSSTFQ